MSEHNDKCLCGCQQPLFPEGVSRKDFLKKIGAATLGLGLSPLAGFALHEGVDHGQSFLKSKAVQDGKAVHLTFLQTSDIHGQVNVHDEFFWENNKAVFKKRGGFAHLKTMLNELRALNPNTLLLDGGDCFQGSAIAAMSEGQAVVPLMNDLRYDLMLPGNWEVVYGKAALLRDMNMYTARKICSNMFNDKSDELLLPGTQVFTIAGVKIGFVGYNDPLTPIRQPPAFSAGIRFLQPEVNVAENIKKLKEEHNCHLVIAMTHMGMAQQLHLAGQPYAQGLDYIFGADTHERIRQPLQGKYARVTEPGAFAAFVGKMDLIIENGKIKEETYALLEVDPDKYKADADMTRLIEKAHEPYKSKISKVLGESKTPLLRYYVMETPMDNLITDAIMWKAGKDIALSSGYRFCPPLVPEVEGKNVPITVEYLWSMLPVDSEVRFAEITGQQIWDWLEQELENVFAKDPTHRFGGWLVRFKGMTIKFTIANEKGKRLKEVKVGSEKLKKEKIYSVAACEREGDPENVLCRIKEVKNPHNAGYTVHMAVEEYLASHSPVAPVQEGRAVATDAPATLLTQIKGVNYQFR